MKNGFRVVDADRHIIEPADLFERYMEPAFRGRVEPRARQGVRMVDGELVSDASGCPEGAANREERGHQIFGGDADYREVFGEAIAAGFDPPSNLRDMDARASTSACSSPRSACTSSGRATSSRKSRRRSAAPTTTGLPSTAARSRPPEGRDADPAARHAAGGRRAEAAKNELGSARASSGGRTR